MITNPAQGILSSFNKLQLPSTKPSKPKGNGMMNRSNNFTKMSTQSKQPAITAKQIQFESTSFIRGVTYDNSIIVVDEMQNLNFHELDSVITRVGRNSKIIFCGDYRQSDFKHKEEKNGIINFIQIVEQLKNFTIINFGWEDIVRSDFVRDYIMTKEMLGF